MQEHGDQGYGEEGRERVGGAVGAQDVGNWLVLRATASGGRRKSVQVWVVQRVQMHGCKRSKVDTGTHSTPLQQPKPHTL